MILSRTPFRVSFIGGGTDYEKFYNEFGGSVISTTVNKYVYIAVNKRFEDTFRISYSKNEYTKRIIDIEHSIVKNCLKDICPSIHPLEIVSLADIPSEGTGLGSSSAFTVGLLNALSHYLKNQLSLHEMAEKACIIEIDKCNSPIGKQDQYGCTFGGLKRINFDKNKVSVSENYSSDVSNFLEKSILFFYTGRKRKSNSVLSEMSNNINYQSTKKYLQELLNLTNYFHDALINLDLKILGEILDQSWNIKKKLAKNVSSYEIDNVYQIAKNSGAFGGKILGAGNGGFFMFIAPEEHHSEIIENLNFLDNVSLKFENDGAVILKGK